MMVVVTHAPATGPPPDVPPLAREIPYRDPLELFAVVAGDRHAALLHSAADDGRGRHSLIALEPFGVLTGHDGATALDGRGVPGSPFDALRRALGRHRSRHLPGLPPLQGGAVGYLGYELARHLERVPLAPAGADDPPEAALLLCDVVVCLDNRARRAFVVSSGLPETGAARRGERARARLDHVAARLADAPALGPPPAPARAPAIDSTFTRAAYERGVRRVIDYILAGDVFQANLSQRFSTALPPGLSPYDLFRRLQAANPAPFGAYLKIDDLVVASSSPERFLLLRDGHVETRPIKGTRPRGDTPDADESLARELAGSVKDRAENVMIVDLMRNDLSRVCRDGSVAVPQLCAVERFATVMHLVSSVTGELRPGLGAVDLLEACFPGGSITGAPKIRAMEIIAELEPTRRGPYCGAIGHVGLGRLARHQRGHPHLRRAGRAGHLRRRRRRRRGVRPRGRVRRDPHQGARSRRRPLAVIVLIDNHDSFVHNLARYVRELGWSTAVVRCDAVGVADVAAMEPTHLIISPGPRTPAEAGVSVDVVRTLGPRVPTLGVCLGHQCIGQAFGGRVVRARRPMHGTASWISHDGRGIYAGLPDPLLATRYHSLVVAPEGLPDELEVTARSEEGEIMGLRHREHPIVGVQFHPESVLTVLGHDLLRAFLAPVPGGQSSSST